MKVVFLDWYKTLSENTFWQDLEAKNENIYKAITTSCFIKNKDLIGPWMRGVYTSEVISQVIARDTHISSRFILKELIKSAKHIEFADKQVFKIIGELQQKAIKIVLATDNMDTFTRFTVPSLKLNKLFDGILSSWEMKALKEDFLNGESMFFSEYLKVNTLRPSDCVLIDDSEDKNNNLKNFGVDYIRIKNSLETSKILNGILLR